MRPLNFDAGGQFWLTSDLIDKLHPYTILSHTLAEIGGQWVEHIMSTLSIGTVGTSSSHLSRIFFKASQTDICRQRVLNGFEMVSACLEGVEDTGQSVRHTLERLGQPNVLSSTVVGLD